MKRTSTLWLAALLGFGMAAIVGLAGCPSGNGPPAGSPGDPPARTAEPTPPPAGGGW